jgi:hypothetical protein
MSLNELFFIDGDITNLIVMSLQSDSQSAYFYFPFEYTFDFKRLLKPSGGIIIKSNDIEPVKLGEYKNGSISFTLAMSRYHYYGLVLWINPPTCTKSNECKPVVIFANISHTPIIWMDNNNQIIDLKIINNKLNPFQKIDSALSKSLFKVLRKVKKKNIIPNYYPSIVSEIKASVIKDPSQQFDNSSIMNNSNYVYLIGSQSDINLVQNELIDNTRNISSYSLTNFFQNITLKI